ncbi:MAG: helix-turn-helix domain-containing protein [Pseudomonadota bacterium]|nr:helix-turn-helix domain-containing protein [Pseudomonadota bacterium]
MALSDVIREARIRNNLKQEYAALLMDVTVQTYSKWENGITEPKASQVAQLSDLLNVSTQMICCGKQSEKIDMVDFIRIVSRQAKDLSEFEMIETIWHNIEDDATFLEALKKLNSEDKYEAVITMKKIAN